MRLCWRQTAIGGLFFFFLKRESSSVTTQTTGFNRGWIMRLWVSQRLIVPVLYAFPSPAERKQAVRGAEEPDDVELNSAKLAAASAMHQGELRCRAPDAELRQPYWHICQGWALDRDKWTNSGTQKLIQTARNNQGE